MLISDWSSDVCSSDLAQHAIDVQPVGIDRMMPGKGFAKGVERAGPDVAEHHADRADRKLQLAVAVMRVAVVARVGEGRSAVRAGRHLLRLSSHGAAL